MRGKATFSGGRNLAMKVPSHLFEATVRFYRDVAGLPLAEHLAPSVVFQFGANRLWIDPVDGMSQAEIWLELNTDDVTAAASDLRAAGVVRRDEIEALPEGFWISSPASIIHLVCRETDSAWARARACPGPGFWMSGSSADAAPAHSWGGVLASGRSRQPRSSRIATSTRARRASTRRRCATGHQS
jgi:catechol 2,3-dioxygenase-like lactoylglutathione lyase family enzyme